MDEHTRQLARLQGRMLRMEAMMQAVLARLGINPAEIEAQMPPQQRAVLDALLAGDKAKAVMLYSQLYGVNFQTAGEAIEGKH